MTEYEVETFNFWISPRNPHFCVRDRTFLCQTSSLELLFKSGFSLDKCFREGITYISAAEEEHCKRQLQQRADRRKRVDGNNNGGLVQGNDDVSRNGSKTPWWQTFEENIRL